MKVDIQKYFKVSTIHGLAYITNRHHPVERIFWIFSLCLSALFTSFLIFELIIKIWNFPVITYMSDQTIPVSEINFPAVTVCPRLVLDYHKRWKLHPRQWYEKHTLKEIFYTFEEAAYEFVDERRFGNISYLEFLERIENGSIKPQELGMKLLKSLQVVDLIKNRGTFSKINFSIPTDDFLDDINQFYKEFAISFSEIIFRLFFKNQEYIAEIITQWGLCFTYNVVFSHDLLNTNATSDDFHYIYSYKMFNYKTHIPALPPKSHDFPVKISSSQKSLWIGFDSAPRHEINLLNNDFDGYVVLFHDSFELPFRFSKIIKFNKKFQTRILIDPQINSIDESLLGYEPAERNCYLENEKILKFFKIYSKSNCEQECLSEFMLSRCGCVEFFMIRNSTTRICRASEHSCYQKAEDDFEAQISTCECFETCKHVNHKFDVIISGESDTHSMDHNLLVGFQVQYKTSEINQFIRKKQFTILEFLSFVGGILGLFAGFSAISFVELLYWFGIGLFIEKLKKVDSKKHSQKEDEASKLTQIKESVKFYFNESSVHGMSYIFDSSWISRILWILFILTSMTFCLHMILNTTSNVLDSRVIAYDDNLKHIKNIPFPAVTILPPFTFPYSYLSVKLMFGPKYATKYDIYNETTYEAYKRRVTRYFLCWEWYQAYTFGYNFSFVPYVIDVMRLNSAIHWFRQQHSVFNGRYQPQFAEVRTPRGHGFTFNMIEAHEMFNFNHISTVFNYTNNVTMEPENLRSIPKSQKYPLKFKSNDQVILTLKIRNPVGYFTSCIKQSLNIHHYDSSPTFTAKKDFTSFDFGTTIDAIVIPEITRTDKSLKKLHPKKRGCYFDGEKSLHFFKKYSQKNCEIECLANLTLLECGCVDIDQPFRTQDDICVNISRRDPTCVNELQNMVFLYSEMMPENNCACLPLCNSISYNVKYYTMHEKEIKRPSYDWQSKLNDTTINVRMNMDEIILYRRYQQFTSSDVVSYVGGLLGLFAGISMLSIVEFFYFFTVRLGVDLERIFKIS